MLILSTLLGAVSALAYATSRAWNHTVRGESYRPSHTVLFAVACAIGLALASVRLAPTSKGPLLGLAAGIALGDLLSLLLVRRYE